MFIFCQHNDFFAPKQSSIYEIISQSCITQNHEGDNHENYFNLISDVSDRRSIMISDPRPKS